MTEIKKTRKEVPLTGTPSQIELGTQLRDRVTADFDRLVQALLTVASNARQLLFKPRNFPQRFSNLRGPIFQTRDASLIKNTRIREGMNAQFRAEAFHLFNTPTIGSPSTAVTSTAFGRIVTTEGYPRQLQLAVRFVF